MSRWLLALLVVLAFMVALTTLPQRSRADEQKWALYIWTEIGWLIYVSPKGYISRPQSRFACEVDRLSVANLQQGYRLECRPVR